MDEIALVQLANEVMSKLPGSPRVEHWKDINSNIFVKLYEGLFAEALPDVIRHPKGREDEIHNIQSVIDTLSLDILNTSLSHLSGEAIVARNKEAIKSLLEVFEWLFDYILEKIGSEASTDFGEDTVTLSKLSELEDPDIVTPEVIDSILERELGRKDYSRLTSNNNSRSEGRPKSVRSNKSGGNSTEELIALGHTHSVDHSQNGSIADATSDLIALGNSKYFPNSPAVRGPKTDRRNTNLINGELMKPKTSDNQENGAFYSNGSINIRDTDRYLLTGDVSSIREPDNLLQAGISSQQYKASEIAKSKSDTLSSNIASNRPVFNSESSSRNIAVDISAELSSGPLSDVSDRALSNGAGKETTADLIRESESIEQRLGLQSPSRSTYDLTTPGQQSAQYQTPGMDLSLTSSMSYPKPIESEPGIRSAEFAHIGAGPAPQTGINYKDNLANSLPLGHQYHNFTHHLYHHYDPNIAQRQPKSASSHGAEVSAVPTSTRKESASTQVTPGRFLGDNLDSGLSKGVTPTKSVSSKPSSCNKPVNNLSKTAPPTQSPQSRPYRMGGLKSFSYDNLRYLIQDTMNMSQNALQNSPLRNNKKAASAVHINDELTDDELSQRLRETLQKLHLSGESGTDRSRSSLPERTNTKRQENIKPKQSILSPKSKGYPEVDRTSRKVSFMTTKSSDENQLTDQSDSITQSPVASLSRSSFEKRTASTKSYCQSPRAAQFKSTYGRSMVKRNIAPKQNKSKPAIERKTSSRRVERLARTADEYFNKYYGSDTTPSPRRRTKDTTSPSPRQTQMRMTSLTTDDSLLQSDVEMNYTNRDDSCEADYSGDFQAEIEDYKRQLRKRSKQVRFDDILDDSAPGHMGGIRRKLMNEEKKTRFRSEFLKDLYEQEMLEFEGGMQEQMKKLKLTSKDTNKEYKKKVSNSPKVRKHHPGNKYQRAQHSSVLLPKSKARNRTVSQGRSRKRSSISSPAVNRTGVPDNEILPWLLEQFPYLYISPESLHDMWRKSAKQIEVLSKTDQYVRSKKNRAQAEIEEAENKQTILANIAKKELRHNATMRELDERRKEQQAVKSSIRDKRQQHARVRKYYDEYHVRMRSKMLKKRSREEMIFKKLFEEGLKIQKDRIRDLRHYARDQREQRAQKQKDELESIENLYRDRFMMLAEALEQEKQERILKNKAQQKVLGSLNREFRKKTEKEIESIQDQIFRDEDDEYFRQIDADRLRQELNLARYKARV